MTVKRASASSPDGPGKALKRRRVSAYVPDTDETPDKTTEAGLGVLDQIKAATDKYGRTIATEFLDLPDRDEHPDYYQVVKLPISLDAIEEKLKNHEYPKLTPFESDLRRLVSNAKFYNEKTSMLFSNAERIRKIIVATMPKLNPAYKDKNYAPFPTPVPDEEEEELSRAGSLEQTPKRETRSTKSPHGEQADEDDTSSFQGETFESAQEKIVSEMIRLKDADGEEVFYPFLSKPDRNMYKEYYEIIKHPTSLNTILKLVRGTDGRRNSTKTTPFRTWQAFEEEVSYIWRNAREFNEDGSEIFTLAGSLESYFKRRLAEARKTIPEPAPGPTSSEDAGGPRIKLRMGSTKTPEPPPQKLKLRFPGKTDGRTDTDSSVQNDPTAARRQQEANGRAPSLRQSRDRSVSQVAAPSPLRQASQDQPRPPSAAGVGQGSPPAPSIKSDVNISQSPGIGRSTRLRERESERLASAEAARESPSLQPNISPYPGISRAPSGSVSETPFAKPMPARSTLPIDVRLKHRRRDVRHALISNVSITTPPSPSNPQTLHIDIPPSPTTCQQSITLTLAPPYHALTLIPTVASSSLQRQTQLSVTAGSQKLSPIAVPVRTADKTIPRYEVALGVGVTRVDVEMLAGPSAGLQRVVLAEENATEFERVTLFVNLLRA